MVQLLTKRLAIVSAAALLAFGLVELGLRLREWHSPTMSLERMLATLPADQGPESDRWIHAVRPHRNPKIAYGLRPGFDGHVAFAGVRVAFRVNSYGFRGPEWTVEKPPEVVRILGLGDSVMMGFGVEEHETYMALLGRYLTERHPGLRVETINLAVGGYNTVQQVEVLKEVGLAFQPDMVLVHMVSNDHYGILYLGYGRDPFELSDSYFAAEFLRPRKANVGGSYAGWGHLRAALAQLEELRRERGFLLLVTSHEINPQNGQMLSVAREFGMATLDMEPLLHKHIVRLGLSVENPHELYVPGDGHPSALYHGLMAEDLYEAMFVRGLPELWIHHTAARAALAARTGG